MDPGGDPRLKLVLVDEHDRARTALAKRLDGHGQLVVSGHTADPSEALALVQSASPHIALVDPVRSDGRGGEIVSSLAAVPELQRPLVFVHLAFFDSEIWGRTRSAGADDLVLKLLDVEELASRLLIGAARLLPRERWPSILRLT
jgi:DNA-binding NarL/FixJ family response regulator